MSDRYTHFLIDVPIAGDPDLIAQADDVHLLNHAEDTLVETVGETAAGWFRARRRDGRDGDVPAARRDDPRRRADRH